MTPPSVTGVRLASPPGSEVRRHGRQPMSTTAIADYALLSDRHSAALVSRAGAVDWLCFPRFDSPAVFARLLDADAGHFTVRPVGEFRAQRRYLDATMVLQTSFRTSTGTVVLTDAMATGAADDPHRLGATAPRLLVRAVECTTGEVTVEVQLAPRPEYGLVAPLLTIVDGGVQVRGGADMLVLSCPVPLQIADGVASGCVELQAGQRMLLGVTHRSTSEAFPAPLAAAELSAALQDTVDAWQGWSAVHQSYQGPWQELVHHSGRVLQALSYQPTGAIVAAPTTSLPEGVGGERNWDYRYTWVRDACFTLEALWVAACPDEAHQFFDHLAVSAAGSVRGGQELQIMFGIGGEHDLSERELPHLRGWREFLVACADTAAVKWREADQGIWEIRGEPRHFLYSKLMCWVALDRAIALAGALRAADRVPDWRAAAAEIRSTILEGYRKQFFVSLLIGVSVPQ
ncbi:MAG TPA: glycoside hydrolase family 15 protein [Pseudonocardiaceae bacterium]